MSGVAQLKLDPPTAPAPDVAIGSFEVAMVLTQQRTLKMSGAVFARDTPADINARIDLFQDTLDRQFVRADIQNKEAQIAAATQDIENINDAFQGLLAKKNGGKALTSQEKANFTNYEPSVDNRRKHIDSLKAAIAAARAKLVA